MKVQLSICFSAFFACSALAACVRGQMPEQKSEQSAQSVPDEKPNRTAAMPTETEMGSIVRAVMGQQYGNFDPSHDCWEYAIENESPRYCMASGPARWVHAGNETLLFFYAYSRPDTEPGDTYSAADPGVMGAFALKLGSVPRWNYVAIEKAMTFGTNGYCGCDQAKFVKLDRHGRYGWLFASGGVWQGIVVSNYSIVAPMGEGFEDLSAIPEVTEEEQDARYVIEVVETPTGDGLFPLRVTKTKDGSAARGFLVEFDAVRGRYALPGT